MWALLYSFKLGREAAGKISGNGGGGGGGGDVRV